MGMGLEPVNPTAEAPRHPPDHKHCPNEPVWGRYNWTGWSWLWEHLAEWGIDTRDFSGSNDGELIPAEKCVEVANAIEAHIGELDEEHQAWLRPHIKLWRTCGGYRQF